MLGMILNNEGQRRRPLREREFVRNDTPREATARETTREREREFVKNDTPGAATGPGLGGS